MVMSLPVICVLVIVPPPSSSRMLPPGPMSTVVATVSVTWLPVIFVLRMVNGLEPTSIAASKPTGSPLGASAETELPEMTVFATSVGALSPTWMPPEFAFMSITSSPARTGSAVVKCAPLSLTSVFLTLSDPPSTKRPPPSAKRPLGITAIALLRVTTELVIVSAPSVLQIAPPSASLAMPPTRLSAITECVDQ